MRRLLGTSIALVALVLLASPASAQGSTAPPSTKATAPKPSAPKSMIATGTVTAVAPDSITVKGKTDEWTFSVDKTTTVTAKGATHKTLALKAAETTPKLTDFVKTGDSVSVTYKDVASAHHAATIRVIVPAK